MTIVEIPNDELKIQKIAMSCDKAICDSKKRSVAAPLMKTSHMYIVSGASGSGKSNLIVNLLKSTKTTKDKKHKKSYRNAFDNIVLVSPSAHTISNSPLENIADDQKFNSLNEDVFDMVISVTDNAIEDNQYTLLILDDVSSQLRLKENEKLLTQLVKNRRHLNLSIWIVTHKVTDAPPALRSNANLIFLFKPKTNKEIETIQSEYMMMPKKEADELMRAAYKDRYDFLLIDTSLRTGSEFLFFRNYNQLKFEKDKTDSN
jgi:ATP:corrinoid adenosyltransferase